MSKGSNHRVVVVKEYQSDPREIKELIVDHFNLNSAHQLMMPFRIWNAEDQSYQDANNINEGPNAQQAKRFLGMWREHVVISSVGNYASLVDAMQPFYVFGRFDIESRKARASEMEKDVREVGKKVIGLPISKLSQALADLSLKVNVEGIPHEYLGPERVNSFIMRSLVGLGIPPNLSSLADKTNLALVDFDVETYKHVDFQKYHLFVLERANSGRVRIRHAEYSARDSREYRLSALEDHGTLTRVGANLSFTPSIHLGTRNLDTDKPRVIRWD